MIGGRGRPSAGVALFFALLAATLAVAVLVVRARTPDLVLEVLKPDAGGFAFSPGAPEGRSQVRFTFFVRRADAEARVTVVDSHEDVVKTLDDSVALSEDMPVSYVWDGSTDGGEIANPGRYRLGVELPESDREMVWPIRVTLNPGDPEPSDPGSVEPAGSSP